MLWTLDEIKMMMSMSFILVVCQIKLAYTYEQHPGSSALNYRRTFRRENTAGMYLLAAPAVVSVLFHLMNL